MAEKVWLKKRKGTFLRILGFKHHENDILASVNILNMGNLSLRKYFSIILKANNIFPDIFTRL